MSQAQIGFLVLVFVATFAVAIWLLPHRRHADPQPAPVFEHA